MNFTKKDNATRTTFAAETEYGMYVAQYAGLGDGMAAKWILSYQDDDSTCGATASTIGTICARRDSWDSVRYWAETEAKSHFAGRALEEVQEHEISMLGADVALHLGQFEGNVKSDKRVALYNLIESTQALSEALAEIRKL